MITLYEKNGCHICGRKVRGNPGAGTKFLCPSCYVLYDCTMIGLYIGRFEPFHKGHLKVITDALKDVKKLIIVVAIPLRKTSDNPFSAEERKEMIEAALNSEGIRGVAIYTLMDIPSDDEYVAHVRMHLPPFNIVYVGDNKLNEGLFRQAGFNVKTSDRFFGISSTEIREKMRHGKHWKDMVPNAVASYIEKHNLVKRVKDS